ncbi:MAG: pseudouridine synthase [Alteromonadaceae bacterium]|nr:MAG: pseudouridine synthase [Alteromonadaceae bacterium]
MGISKYPSKISLPQLNPGVASVLDYLIIKFPAIGAKVWLQRMAQGKVHWHDGALITPESPYKPQQRVYYYREVECESTIPFKEEILFHDEYLLIAYKPHFLPVTPGGKYVNECLQNRLRRQTANADLQALHRLDRVTAGLVLFSLNPASRSQYHNLFELRQIQKTYQAIAQVNTGENLIGQQWEVKNRIEKSELGFRMQIVDGESNSHSMIRCLSQCSGKALFELKPITGKTHQLRLHMQSLGWPILYDKYYPVLQEKTADVYSRPLQLLAKKLAFIDPITQQNRVFSCDRDLVIE